MKYKIRIIDDENYINITELSELSYDEIIELIHKYS